MRILIAVLVGILANFLAPSAIFAQATMTPKDVIESILNRTQKQQTLSDDFFDLVRDKSYAGGCFELSKPSALIKDAKFVSSELMFINGLGLQFKRHFYASAGCTNRIHTMALNHPYRVHARVGNRFLVEILGDVFVGIQGYVDIFDVSIHSIATTAETIGTSMGDSELAKVKADGQVYRVIGR